MKKKRIFRSSMSYDKSTLCGLEATLGASGISLPRESNFRQAYNMPDNWLQLGSMWSSLNDPKFYKDVNMQDIIPKEEDFIEVPFRLISATIVGGGSWKATDFSNAKVLKASKDKLIGKGVYKDHETDVDNWAGLVKGVKWTPETTQNGIKVPAGIDGVLAIDAKTNPKLARGILLGSLYSNSVTVNFTWSMSHQFENEWDFYDKIGTIGSDGKMVRRIVEDIVDYHETSIVWLGADPFAKSISDDGELKHIDMGSVYEFAKMSYSKSRPQTAQLTEEQQKEALRESVKNKKMTIDFGLDKNVLSLAQRQELSNNNENQKEMNKFMIAFIAAFGAHFNLKEGQEVDDETMAGFVKDLSLKQDGAEGNRVIAESITALMKEVSPEATDVPQFLEGHSFIAKDRLATLEGVEKELETTKSSLTAMTTERDNLKPMADLGTKTVEFKREEAIRLYKATVGTENVNESVLGMFKKATSEEVDGLLAQYTKGATEKFSGTCASCGSHDFKFQSSYTGEKSEEVTTSVSPTFQDLSAKYGASSMTIGR